MKRFFLILCILGFPIFSFGQWVDSDGSTWTPTAASVKWELKDVAYDVHNRTTNSLRIEISSQTIFLIDEMGHVWVRASTNSLTGIYYGGNTAVVRAGDTDNLAPSTQGLQTQANMHVYNSNKWHRLIGQATNYHNLRVTIFDSDRPWEVNDFDSDDQAEGRDGVIVYSYISGWDAINDDWDRLRLNLMKYLYVVTSSESWTNILQGSVTLNAGSLDEVKRVLESTGTIQGGSMDEVKRVLQSTTCVQGGSQDEIKRILQSTTTVRGGVLDEVTEIKRVLQSTCTPIGGSIDEVKRILQSTTTIRGGNLDQVDRIVESTAIITGIIDPIRIKEGTVTISGGVNLQISTVTLVVDGGTVTVRNVGEPIRVRESTTCVRGGELDQVNRILESSGVIKNFPSDYPDATSQSSLSSIDTNLEHCDTHDVVITSGSIRKMTFNQSTGTVLSVGAGATVPYTLQSTVAELFVDSINDNTDTVRMRFFDDNVITGGVPIYIGTGKIIDTWKGTIYFQAESGTQLIIVNEVYE